MEEQEDRGSDEREWRLHQVRLEFRELLTICKLDREPWFWYAEAVTWDRSEEWWPLLGNRGRARGTTCLNEKWFDYKALPGAASKLVPSRPQWYKTLLDATKGDKVLSVISVMQRQFSQDGNGPSQATHPIFGFFREEHAGWNKAKLEAELERVANLVRRLSGRYTVVPQGKKDATNYKNYLKLLVKRPFSVSDDSGNPKELLLYPECPWLLALPIYELRDRRPILLASILIFASATEELKALDSVRQQSPEDHEKLASAEQRVQDLFYQIQRCLLDLEVKATHLLTHRYHGAIEGYMPGQDPIVLLAHPALTRKEYRSRISLNGDHHKAESFIGSGFGSKTRRHENAHYYERIFERSLAPLRSMQLKGAAKFLTLGAFDPFQGTKGDTYCQDLSIDTELGYAAWHRWLKSLYAHSPAQAMLPVAPSTDNDEYALFIYQLAWLVPLLAATFREDTTSCIGIEENSAGKNGKEQLYRLGINSEFWAGVARPPSELEISNALDNNVQNMKLFLWPVQPGIRFLIPWLHLAKHLRHTLRKQIKGTATIAILLPGSGDGVPKPFQVCLKRLPDTERGGGDMSGLWVAYPLDTGKVDEVKRAVAGWRSALYDPVRRRGDDTLPFTWLQAGDIGAVLKDKHLLFETPEAVLQPLVGAMAIHLDFFVSDGSKHGKYLFLCTSWNHKQPRQGG